MTTTNYHNRIGQRVSLSVRMTTDGSGLRDFAGQHFAARIPDCLSPYAHTTVSATVSHVDDDGLVYLKNVRARRSIVNTLQSASLDTNTGRNLLRKIVRHTPTHNDEWTLRAGENTDWKVVFTRRIQGELGEPDSEVVVETDSTVRIVGETGRRRPFHDAEEVTVPATRRIGLWCRDSAMVAQFLLDGWSLEVQHSAGSTHSSQHGMAWSSLRLVKGLATLTVGFPTIYVHGVQVCSGSCST
jgi:hypothetical protein